ncbi:hypothetical protein I4U23_021405 [Adineta vaga]|nr:hypothetical protein I4U23_021405 [Adineta vaga]
MSVNIRTIEFIYQEKLSSIKANYIQLSNYLQEFQFEKSSQIQELRNDLEQMKFIRSTYESFLTELIKLICIIYLTKKPKECRHPRCLQQHYRQCNHRSTCQQIDPSKYESKLLDDTTLKTVTNI